MWNRVFFARLLECFALIALLTNGILGPGLVDVTAAQVRAVQTAEAIAANSTRLSPASTPREPVSAWYAPNRPVGNAFFGPASSAATPQGRQPGEQPDLRTATSETFLNADGSWTLKTSPVPMHYLDAQGHWQPIDTTLVADTSDSGYAYGTRANGWHVHFAAQAGGTVLVHAQFPSGSVGETLNGAATVPATISGSSVVYAGVFPGVDLSYSVGARSLEETLLLHQVPTALSFSFTYHLVGASVQQDAAGNLIFTDANNNVILTLGGVLMYEATARGRMAPGAALSEHAQLAVTGSAPNFIVTLTPDQAWLSDPTRHFPVAIDPTWQSGDPQTNTTNGNIYGDTFDESGNPTLTFYNVNSERIGNANVDNGLCCNGTSRSYLKFPINPPPTAVRVTSADLALYQSSQYSGGGVQINANAIFTAWNETTLTWNNHPTSVTYGGQGTTAATQNTWVHLNVTSAVYYWWEGGLTLNGFELQYNDETKPQEFFFSDDNTNSGQRPLLTINYVQDTTAPGGGLLLNGGATATRSSTVTVAPTGSDAGSLKEWGSNWATVNGVGTNGGYTAASWSVDSAGTQLTADTSSCGSTQCWAQTFFTHTINNMNNWPTFTAAFKTDTSNGLHFGVISGSNAQTRFLVYGSSTGFSTLEYSTTAGSYNSVAITTIPISANTWYYGQVVFPLPTVGEIYIWPVGTLRPTTPTVSSIGLAMTNPGMVFWQYGDNGANHHQLTVGNVWMSSKDTGTGTIGYGLQSAEYSSDNATWGCPPYSGPSSFSGGPWCVYTDKTFSWTFAAGDGTKKLWVKYVDSAGNQTGSTQASILVDNVPPNVSGIALGSAGNVIVGNNEVRGVVTVLINGSDPLLPDGSSDTIASGILYVDGVQAGTAVIGTTTPTFTWDTTNVSQGRHTLTATLTDAAGNVSALSAQYTVMVSNTALMGYETLAKRTLPDHATDVSVNVANGDGIVSHSDLDIAGRGPDISLTRTYHALGAQSGLFGQGWSSELDEGLTVNGDGSLTYRDPSGGLHLFLPNGSNPYRVPPGIYVTLVKNGDGTYTMTTRDQTKTNFDTTGLLTSVVDRNGNTLSVAYSGGLPTTVTDAAGRVMTITITGGHVTALATPGSRTYGYAYDGSGNLTDYTDPSGVVAHYDYDSSHRLTKITLNKTGGAADQQTNVVTTLTYDTVSTDFQYNRLTKIVDPLGYDADMSYSIPAGGTAMQTQVQQLQVVSPATYETTTYLLTTEGLGAVAKLTDALNNATQYQYDGNENVTQVTDPLGHVATATYDSQGNKLTQVVDPGSSPHLALTTSWTYDSANNVLTQTDPRGIVTQYTYDTPTTGNVTKVVADYVNGGPTNSDTNVTGTATYDSSGEALTATDPLGHVTKLTYDSQGDVLTTTANYVSGGPTDSQTNVTTSATYDALGERLTATNALGVVTQYGYDILGHLIQTVANYSTAHGANEGGLWNITTTTGYDPLGRQVTVTNPLGIVTLTVYDADGRVLKTIADYVNGGPTDVQTNVTTMTASYDAAGNTLVATDAKGNTTTTVYDLDNRPTQVTYKDNATPTPNVLANSKTVYNAAGQVSESDTLDGSGNLITKVNYAYDATGRQLTQTDPPEIVGFPGPLGTSNVTTTSYDADSNALEVKTTNAALTSPGVVNDATSTFDKLNRPLTKTEQANTSSAQTTSFVYDLDGRQTSVTDPANKTTSVTYDALGRVLTVTHPDTTVDTTTYDAAGERLTQANTAGTTKDTYDALGRVIYEERDDGTGAFQTSVTTSYDANSNKLSELTNFPGGTNTTYTWTYDKLDRQATMSDGSRSYTYDINGNVTQMVVNGGSGNADEADLAYDGANRLTTLTDKVTTSGSTLHNYSYQYDLLGNRTQITQDGTATTYSYDNLDQLTQIKQGSTTLASYAYDANNNRVSMVTSVGTTTYTYDTASDVELLSKTDPNGKVTTYTYDTNGNLTKATYDPTGANQITSYIYDSNNRLIEVDEPSGTKVQFTYDADGNRISKAVTSGGTTTTIKDVYALGRLAYQTDGAGNKLATFTYDTNGMPSSVVVGSGTTTPRYYYVYNGHGDVVALTDSTGTVVASYSYDAFGTLTASSESLPNGWSNPYRYDGKDRVRYDAETGLYWLSVRAYDPTLGRFISHDPLGRMAALGLDRQPYVYVDNNPVVRTDPEGMIGPCGGRPMFDGEVCVPVSTPPPPPPGAPAPPHKPCAIATNGCSGGSGKTPNTAGSGSGNGQPSPTKTQINKARSLAQQMHDGLVWLTWALGLTAGADAVLSGTLFLKAALETEAAVATAAETFGLSALIGAFFIAQDAWRAANFAALGANLGLLATETGILASIFGDELNWNDSQWTTGNIELDAAKILGIMGTITTFFGIIIRIGSRLGLAGWGIWGGAGIGALVNAIFGGLAGATLFQESMALIQ